MYRCTDCKAEYNERPEYCECGNNRFEQAPEYGFETEDFGRHKQQRVYSEPVRRQMSAEEYALSAKEHEERIKSFIAAGITVLLCILVFILPPHRKNNPAENPVSTGQTQSAAPSKLPSVNTFWDDSVSGIYKKNDPAANLPLLNSRLNSLPPALREYIVSIGRYFNNMWDTSVIKGAGSCKVQFVINKEGGLDIKNIISSSGNQNLDDSVSLLLTETTGFENPPAEYKGEKIYILFTVNQDGTSKVYYPSK